MTSPDPNSEQQTWRVLAHASALIQFIGVPSFVGPLAVWLIRREDTAVEPHAREALNFQLSLIIYFAALVVIGIIAAITIVGLLLVPILILLALILVVAEVVFAILAALAASRGELYRYPMNLGLIKG